MYAGVPHPPGYPVWTIYTWLFTVLFPVSNIAYRVGMSSAVAGAFGCGIVAMLVSRGSSMIIEGMAELRQIDRRLENALCIVAGFVAGMLIGFNGFMWSQAVIVEVYTLSVLSLAGVLLCLLRWIYAPHQRGYLYLAFFWFGICFNNHQSLLVTALGIEAAVIAVASELSEEDVKAFVIPSRGRSIDIAALDAFARSRLARFKVPRYYEVVSELPHTPTGRLAKRQLSAEHTPDEIDTEKRTS